MVRQIEKQSVVGSWRSAACRCGFVFVFIVAASTAVSPNLMAESLASKNNKGNRFFAQGKYEEAEKAYLDAQVKDPGKPEVLYNLGNSLIKQKKYEQGIQSLRQSIDKGDKETKETSWFNTGNALYSMGNFKESAEAYIQALRLNPADGDAKHNLELALMKQQEQKQSDSSRKQLNKDKSDQDQASSGNDGRPQQQKQNETSPSGNQNEPGRQPQPRTPQETRREGSISKEQAAQILDALQNQELEQQRKLLEGRARRNANEKDW